MNNIDLRISSIQDVLFYINAPNAVIPEDIGVKIEGKKMDIDADTKTVSFLTEVAYVRNYSTLDVEVLLTYTNRTSFYIENFADIFALVNEQYVFDSGVAQFLTDIILSTIRGILFAKTAGTELAKCYLPLIKADQIITT